MHDIIFIKKYVKIKHTQNFIIARYYSYCIFKIIIIINVYMHIFKIILLNNFLLDPIYFMIDSFQRNI